MTSFAAVHTQKIRRSRSVNGHEADIKMIDFPSGRACQPPRILGFGIMPPRCVPGFLAASWATGFARRDRMRSALIGFATIAAALAAAAQSGSAQESFFNERFCARGGDAPSDAFPDCSFRTWEQCIASARGLNRWCTTNPWWHGPRQHPTTQGKSRRRNG